MFGKDIPDSVIIPPPAVKDVVIKTTSYIKKNGPSFAEKITSKAATDDKFSFIREEDPYHAFYQWVLENYVEETDAKEEEVPEGPKDQFIVKLPPISRKDLDIIKLSALYLSTRGLEAREALRSRNETQFEFLDESHSLHGIFQQFVEQYKALDTVQVSAENLLERCMRRAEYYEYSATQKKDEVDRVNQEKLEFASIDWQDFIVVETIEFTEVDSFAELPIPLNFDDLKHRSLEHKSASTGINIRAAGETRRKRKVEEPMIECPISHKMVPESEFDTHLATMLADPNYKKEKENYQAKHRLTNLSTDDVYANIKKLARGNIPEKKQKV